MLDVNTGRWSRVDGPGAGNPRWAPDGNYFAVRDADDDLRVCEPEGARCHTVHASAGWGVNWSPDSDWLVYTPSDDGTLHAVRSDGSDHQRIWDHSRALPFVDCTWWHTSVWSPDSSGLAFLAETPSSDAEPVRIWRPATGSLVAVGGDVLPDPLRNLARLCWSPDGAYLAVGARRYLWAVRVDGEHFDATLLSDDVHRLWQWQPTPDADHHRVLVGERSATRLIDVDTGTSTELPTVPGEFFEWSPDGRWILYPVGDSRGLGVVRADGTDARTFDGIPNPGVLAFDPSGTQVLVRSRVRVPGGIVSEDHQVHLLDLYEGLRWSRPGAVAAWTGNGERICRWLRTDEHACRIGLSEQCESWLVCSSADGSDERVLWRGESESSSIDYVFLR